MTRTQRRFLIAAPLAVFLSVIALLVPAPALLASGRMTILAGLMQATALAQWISPAAGFAFCALGAWWVARASNGAQVRDGVRFGFVVALLDLLLLLVAGAPFGVLMVSSFAGRVAGGYCGGRLARRTTSHRSPASTASG